MMLITNWKVKDFGPIIDEELFLKKGIYVISGRNYQGKSTFLDNFNLLVFNKTKKEATLKTCIRWGLPGFGSSMEFIHQGKKFKINIKYSKNTERVLEIEGEDKAYTGQDATDKLKEFFDSELAPAAMVANQGEHDLISIGDAERRELLKKIYDLDFSNGIKKLENDLDEVKRELNMIEIEINRLDKKEYSLMEIRDLPFPKSEYEVKESQRIQLVQDRDDLIKKIEIISASKRELESKKESLENLKKTISEFYRKIDDYSNKILEEQQKDFNEIFEKKIEEKKNGIDYRIKSSLGLLNDLTNNINQELSKIKKVPGYDQTEIDENRALLYKIVSNIETLERKKKLWKKGLCPECERPFDVIDEPEFDLQIEDLNKNKKASEETIKGLEESRNLSLAIEKENQKVNQKITALREELVKIEGQIAADKDLREKSIQYLEEQKKEAFANRERMISSYNESKNIAIDDLELQTKTLEELEEKIENIKKDIPARIPIANQFDSQIKRLENEISSYIRIEASNTQAVKFNGNVENEKIKDMEKIVELEKEKEKSEINIKYYSEAVKILKRSFPSYVISKIIINLNAGANKFLERTYGGGNKVSVKESRNGIKIVYGPHDDDVRLGSGYEKQIFSMSFKYAMGQAKDYGLIFLDEVDAFADEENSLDFYQTIGNMRDLYNQIFVISHKPKIKELLSTEYGALIFEVDGGRIV